MFEKLKQQKISEDAKETLQKQEKGTDMKGMMLFKNKWFRTLMLGLEVVAGGERYKASAADVSQKWTLEAIAGEITKSAERTRRIQSDIIRALAEDDAGTRRIMYGKEGPYDTRWKKIENPDVKPESDGGRSLSKEASLNGKGMWALTERQELGEGDKSVRRRYYAFDRPHEEGFNPDGEIDAIVVTEEPLEADPYKWVETIEATCLTNDLKRAREIAGEVRTTDKDIVFWFKDREGHIIQLHGSLGTEGPATEMGMDGVPMELKFQSIGEGLMREARNDLIGSKTKTLEETQK